VAVDLGPWNGDIYLGCATNLTNEYDAMVSAGYAVAGVQAYGDAFVCRIEGDPTPAQQSCVNTPPATAYWSFWYANAGQNTWTYSQQGVLDFEPQPGSIGGWTFGATTSQPALPPPNTLRDDAANPPPPPPPPTTTTIPAGGTPTTTTSVLPSRGSTGGGTGPTTSSPTTVAARTHGGTTAAGSTSSGANNAAGTACCTTTTVRPGPTSRPSGVAAAHSRKAATDTGHTGTTFLPVVDVNQAAGATAGRAASSGQAASSGSPWPVLVGVVLVAGLGATGLVIARRRRST
jgi:hypothetical protein